MPEETINNEVSIITTYEVVDNVLKVVKTPDKVVPTEEVYDIVLIQEEIAKINNAIEQWQAKKAPLQAIIDLYEANKPVVVEE
jgi:hypothetical protein